MTTATILAALALWTAPARGQSDFVAEPLLHTYGVAQVLLDEASLPALDAGVPVRRWSGLYEPAPAACGVIPSDVETDDAPDVLDDGAALPAALAGRCAGDGIVSPQEILQAVIARMEREVFTRRELGGEACAGDGDVELLFCAVVRDGGLLPPWLLDDGDPTTRDDAALRRVVDGIVRRAQARARARGHAHGGDAYQLGVAAVLTDAVMLPEREGGLGIAYENSYTRTPIEAFRTHEGNCVTMAMLLQAMALRAGLRPEFVEVVGIAGGEAWHVANAVPMAGALEGTDATQGTWLEDAHTYTLTRLEMMAMYLRNLSLESNDAERAAPLAEAAAFLAPDFYPTQLTAAEAANRVGADGAVVMRRLWLARTLHPTLAHDWSW